MYYCCCPYLIYIYIYIQIKEGWKKLKYFSWKWKGTISWGVIAAVMPPISSRLPCCEIHTTTQHNKLLLLSFFLGSTRVKEREWSKYHYIYIHVCARVKNLYDVTCCNLLIVRLRDYLILYVLNQSKCIVLDRFSVFII